MISPRFRYAYIFYSVEMQLLMRAGISFYKMRITFRTGFVTILKTFLKTAYQLTN